MTHCEKMGPPLPPGSVKPVPDQKSIRSKGPASIQVVTTRHVVEKCGYLSLQSYKSPRYLDARKFVCVCVLADCKTEVGGGSLFTCLRLATQKRGSGLGSLVQRYKVMYATMLSACRDAFDGESCKVVSREN
jgi:hypothetical protein